MPLKPKASLFQRKARVLARQISRGKKPTLITDHPTFKRSVVTQNDIIELRKKVNALNNRLRTDVESEWQKLREVRPDKAFIRYISVNGKRFVIKDTDKFNIDGHHDGEPRTHGIRQFMLAHQERMRKIPVKDRQYILRTPRLLLVVGRFLVMEEIKQQNINTFEEWEYLQPFYTKIAQDFSKTRNMLDKKYEGIDEPKTGLIPPQLLHIMYAGHYNKKPVFYVPYDYF